MKILTLVKELESRGGWMKKPEQGDIIRIPKGKVPFLVVSSSLYNQSGMAVVCPIVSETFNDAMHVPVHTKSMDGVVLCEQLASVSVSGRGYSCKDHLGTETLLEIVYRVQSIFDYVVHAE